MTRRPVDIHTLLNGTLIGHDTVDKENDLARTSKPVFLSKNERIKRVQNTNMIHRNNYINAMDSDDNRVEFESNYNELKISKKTEKIHSNNINTADIKNKNIEAPTNIIKNGITKRRKFNFDWNENDDTFTNHEPIIPLVKRSRKRRERRDELDSLNSIEQNYIGKSWKDKNFNNMTERDWKLMKEKYNIKIKGIPNNRDKLLNPMRNWHELNLIPEDLLKILTDDLKFVEPTPIQRIAIPNLINIKNKTNDNILDDFVGVSTTGSGKTFAFIIPILIKLSNLNWRPPSIKLLDGPQILILVPTRELALQIQNEIEKITKIWQNGNCQTLTIIGGLSMEELNYNLKTGCDILIATPGRLIDCLENHMIKINMINTLVLDEADKMIDLGFEDQLKNILNQIDLNNDRHMKVQKMLFTATLSPATESIATGYLNDPIVVMVGSNNDFKPRIKQIVQWAQDDTSKFNHLIHNILPHYDAPIILFIKYKTTADWLAQKFKQDTHFKFTILHGSKSQEQRQHSLQLLRSGKADIMIATNVAARGLDIPNVSLVINFQMSSNFDDYVHRIGRTGRAGKSGCAITFVDDHDDQNVIEQLYKYVKDNDTLNSNEFSNNVIEKFNLRKNDFDNIIY